MKLKSVLLGMFSLLTLALAGCGSNGDGLNGSITVSASATGAVVNATATYSNPQQTNLIGQPIDFSVQIGGQVFTFDRVYTNNSGGVTLAFTAPSFPGTQTVTVIAKADKLTNFATISMTGLSLSVTPPPTLALTTTAAAGTAVAFSIPPTATFVTVTDPFSHAVSGHQIQISAVPVPSNPSDTLVSPALTTTTTAGTAQFPGATGTLIVPSTVGGVETMTITWTVTDLTTGLTGTGITTITLTKTA